LRFRLVDVTTLNTPNPGGAQADLRLLNSSDVVVTTSSGQQVTVRGTTVEQPPTQGLGGGLNTTGTVTLPGGSLASGASISVQFVLGVQQSGRFRFIVNAEAPAPPLPPSPPPDPPSSSWSDTRIVALVPANATTGPVVVTVGGVPSNGVTFTITSFADSDNDALPDSWELQFFGNLAQGAGDDPDGDGISNLLEYLRGSNPTKPPIPDPGGLVNLKVFTPLSPIQP
jgi:hypothetical protein